MTLGSLFTGVGMFDLAFRDEGYDIAWQCEIDRTCRSVLRRHFPCVPCFPDVVSFSRLRSRRARVDWRRRWGSPDVIAGGFPCQDLSVAGKRRGLEGSRSGLWFHMLRVINGLRPRLVVWENVPGLLSSDSGRDMARVLDSLADRGYYGAWRVLDARHFGVAQRRRRVFGCFAQGRSGALASAEILALADGVCGHPPAGGEEGSGVAATVEGSVREGGIATTFDWQAGGSKDTSFRGKSRTWVCDKPGIARSISTTKTLAVFDHADPVGPTVAAFGVNALHPRDQSGALSSRNERYDFESDTFVVPIDMRQASRGDKMTNNRRQGSSGGAPGTGIGQNGDDSPTLCESHPVSVGIASGVRRLTPLEYERLMGLPDGWTEFDDRGKRIKDGPRYRMCGNGVVVPVARWIAGRARRVLNEGRI